jgi:hypothetical protein
VAHVRAPLLPLLERGEAVVRSASASRQEALTALQDLLD